MDYPQQVWIQSRPIFRLNSTLVRDYTLC